MEVSGKTADGLYKDLWWRMKTSGTPEYSRNGRVWSITEPVIATLHNPTYRVLFNPARDANPFFHIAEVVWMFSGSNNVQFIEQFNKRYREYADGGIVHGAYGNRWLHHFGQDQIEAAGMALQKDNANRRVVMGMWDPRVDLGANKKDVPCNTQVMFRAVDDTLDMLITNRSNDMVWGMMGANIVHFTYLQEAVAFIAGLELGNYRVVTNNLHVYPDMSRFQEIYDGGLHSDPYGPYYPDQYPLLQPGECWEALKTDCQVYLETLDWRSEYTTLWFRKVALPMMEAYLHKGAEREDWVSEVAAEDWRLAATEWIARRVR